MTLGYTAKHEYLNRDFPRVGRCEFCGCTSKPTEYASVEHRFSEWRHDWFELCKRCHFAFDERGQHPRARTHCVNGHPFDEANTYVRGEAEHRRCRACARASVQKYRAKLKAEGRKRNG